MEQGYHKQLSGPEQPQIGLFAYAEWSLTDLLTEHSQRFEDFLIHKGAFATHSGAHQFIRYAQMIDGEDIEPVLKLDFLRRVYGGRIIRDDAEEFEKSNITRTIKVGENMVRSLQSPTDTLSFPSGGSRPASFLDIGCGMGETTGALANYWNIEPERAIGMDITIPSNVPKNIRFEQMEPDTLPDFIPPESQDLAIVSMVLHHSHHPERLVSQISSVLTPGAYLVVREHNATPKLNNFLDAVHTFYEIVYPKNVEYIPNAKNYKSLEQWCDLIAAQSLELLKVDYKPYPEEPSNTADNMTLVFKKKLVS
jgi:SAM-dependent methyltransferase